MSFKTIALYFSMGLAGGQMENLQCNFTHKMKQWNMINGFYKLNGEVTVVIVVNTFKQFKEFSHYKLFSQTLLVRRVSIGGSICVVSFSNRTD